MGEETKEEKRRRKQEKKEAKEAKRAQKEDGEEKRKELEEIEIDLAGDVPLNKKQQRLLKKGKLNLDRIKAKHPAPKPLTEEGKEEEPKSSRSKFGVWIGNLSFDTTKEDIIRFIESKTDVKKEAITRFNLPKKQDKIKGFCYVDFVTEDQMNQVIALSEQNLNGRKLLIKNASSFEGRPEQPKEKTGSSLVNPSKNPPSRILFVGNLSFDTTDDLLREHFAPCGEIIKIRMATFEDTGKCKGFAFVDFKDETGPTNALTNKVFRSFINRPLRMEYGEDRSKRAPKRDRPERQEETVDRSDRFERPERLVRAEERPERPERPERSYDRERNNKRPRVEARVKSSVALASAQRASAAIVPSTGKKVTFD